MKTTEKEKTYWPQIYVAVLFIAMAMLVAVHAIGQDVVIGTQTWQSANLNYGVMIPMNQPSANNGVLEKYCYNNLESNCAIYGALYDWGEMMEYSTENGSQGICPNGYHVPTRTEIETLLAFLPQPADTAALHLKATGFIYWQWPPAWNWKGYTASQKAGFAKKVEGRDTYGFNLRGGGYGNYSGTSSQITKYGRWWTSTQYTNQPAWAYMASIGASNAFHIYLPYKEGTTRLYHSVRCIKN